MDDEQRAGDGASPAVEQFQQAALDAVRAARAMLDAAEAMIKDPATLESVVRSAAGAARVATETVAGFAAAAGAPRRPGHPPDDDGDGDGYESIEVD